MNRNLLALVLGKGTIVNEKLIITHKKEEKEYLEYKLEKAFKRNISNHIEETEEEIIFCKGIYNKTDQGRQIRKLLYGVMNHKYYSETIVKELDKYCIAILYLDKGYLLPKKLPAYNCKINTYCSIEEAERLQERIKELYNVEFNIVRDRQKYSLRAGTQVARKFIKQVKEEVPSLEYFNETKLKEI